MYVEVFFGVLVRVEHMCVRMLVCFLDITCKTVNCGMYVWALNEWMCIDFIRLQVLMSPLR